MEIKSMSSISNTNFENFNKIKQTNDVSTETRKSHIEKVEPTKQVEKVNNQKEVNQAKVENNNEPVGTLSTTTSSTEKSFDYDMETNTFMIIVKDKDGNIQQYPTEDLLKFKQMIKDELKAELVKELGKK